MREDNHHQGNSLMPRPITGRKQHHIPQMLLKGFTVDYKKSSSILVCKPDKQFLSTPHDYAAERNFYSADITNTDNLDNKITQHEATTISKYLDDVRALPTGAYVFPDVAAELVHHFFTRAKDFRNTSEQFIKNFCSSFREDIKNPNSFTNLFYLNENKFTAIFTSKLLDLYNKSPKLSKIPFHVFVNIVFLELQRNPHILTHAKETTCELLNKVERDASIFIKKGHNKGLLEAYQDPKIPDYLLDLNWKIVKNLIQDEEFILPDCLVISVTKLSSTPYRLLPASDDDVIIFPINRQALLIGSKNETAFNTANYNRYAAENSLEGFVCSPSFSEKVSCYLGSIGKNRKILSKKIVDESYTLAKQNIAKKINK